MPFVISHFKFQNANGLSRINGVRKEKNACRQSEPHRLTDSHSLHLKQDSVAARDTSFTSCHPTGNKKHLASRQPLECVCVCVCLRRPCLVPKFFLSRTKTETCSDIKKLSLFYLRGDFGDITRNQNKQNKGSDGKNLFIY